MLRIRSEVGKGLEINRHAVAAFQCVNNGANAMTKAVCKPRTRFDIARVEVYSAVALVAGVNLLDVCVGLPGVAASLVAAADPNAIVVAGYATIAAQPDIPRRVQITLVDNAGVDLVVTTTVVGRDADGAPLTEVIVNAAPGTGSTLGVQRFREILSVVIVIDAGAGDAVDTLAVDTVDEGVIAQFNPDTIVAGAAPTAQTLTSAACNIPAGAPVWARLVTDNGAVAAPPDIGVAVHWQPYMGAYDGETAYGGYE
jgi:hypothetical protein